MIYSFSCKETEALFNCKISSKFQSIERVARRKLLQLHAAVNLLDLRIPPGNFLEALHGDRAGQHNIRINSQWRVCFVWKADGVCAIEIVDYH